MIAALASRPRRVLFVFAWLVVGGEETEVRLLARHLNPARYRVEVVACFRKPNMPEQTHLQLAQLGVPVDRTPYGLSPEQTVEYLARKMAEYDLVVACQAVREVYPAMERMPPQRRPPLIEHGGLVSEALAGPKYLTARYVGVCDSIRDAAASLMPERPNDANGYVSFRQWCVNAATVANRQHGSRRTGRRLRCALLQQRDGGGATDQARVG